jgi:hypothetical protein
VSESCSVLVRSAASMAAVKYFIGIWLIVPNPPKM